MRHAAGFAILPQRIRAIRITKTGGPGVLDLVDLPQPEPGPGEVVISAQAIGVGKPDVLFRTGVYRWMPQLLDDAVSIPNYQVAYALLTEAARRIGKLHPHAVACLPINVVDVRFRGHAGPWMVRGLTSAPNPELTLALVRNKAGHT